MSNKELELTLKNSRQRNNLRNCQRKIEKQKKVIKNLKRKLGVKSGVIEPLGYENQMRVVEKRRPVLNKIRSFFYKFNHFVGS